MRALSPLHPAACVVAASTLLATPCRAQVHWDVGAQVGAMQRFQTGAGAAPSSPFVGPVGELHAHVAVVPMLRLGPYVTHDIASYVPSAGVPARQITEAGLRAKIAPPLLGGPWHLWGILGLGYARAYWPSHAERSVPVPGIEGDFLDLPVGLGVGYRVRGPRDPWELTAELGARIGLAFLGAMYNDAPRDSFALSLSLGVSLDE
jgi:hypothetical protein